jgi:hypothetical protein
VNTPGGQGKFFVYQIFYDQESRLALDPGFIPLDNTSNERPDWFEFWVIRKFLRENPLRDDAWYGFLSPRFQHTTRFPSSFVLDALQSIHQHADVALFSHSWDQLTYFLNMFEQGDAWHPGLSRLAQSFLDRIEYPVRLDALVTYSGSSVFSNYVVARPGYWNEWLKMADRFFDFIESEEPPQSEFRRDTSYGSLSRQTPMKAFIQERLASIILARGRYRVVAADHSRHPSLHERMFTNDIETRRSLQACDLMKERYCRTGDDEYLKMYWKIRGTIRFKSPMQAT